MRLNPEIQRNIWLECSSHRLIAMPVVLAIVIYLTDYSSQSDYDVTASMAMWIFIALALVWGGHRAAEAVIEEHNEHTWDFQRLSSLSSWDLTFGKLFGSTLYQWYGALMVFAVYLITMSGHLPFSVLLWDGLLILISALICHGAALLSSLQTLQESPDGQRKLRVLRHHIVGLVVGFIFLSAHSTLRDLGFERYQSSKASEILWHGVPYATLSFMAISGAILLGWIIVGINQHMRRQLGQSTTPWLWLGFLVYICYFLSGFSLLGSGLNEPVDPSLLIAFVVAITATYLMAFMESWNGVYYRRMAEYKQQKNWKKFFALLPRWLVSFMLALLLLLWMVPEYGGVLPKITTFGAIVCFFVVRDLGILHYFKLSARNRRAYMSTLFYLGVLYGLIPTIFGILEFKTLFSLFIPLPEREGGHLELTLASSAIQTLTVLALVRLRWLREWRQAT